MSTRTLIAGSADRDRPLVDFLAEQLACSRRAAKALLDQRVVFVNRRRVWMARHPLQPGDRVEVHDPAGVGAPAPGALSWLWSDEVLGVADKPPGLTVTGPDGLETRIRRLDPSRPWQALHRLDRHTSGCVLFACRPDTRDAMILQFRRREITKVYYALVAGVPAAPERTLRTPLDGKTAVTHYRVLQAGPLASALQVRIETGRTHQIRRHLAAIGHPVLGDPAHGTQTLDRAVLRAIPRPMLHARSLGFAHPHRASPRRVESPIPDDILRQARALGIRTAR
jgi:23S rRNA pseudouridine1911/1915/1917 synthase